MGYDIGRIISKSDLSLEEKLDWHLSGNHHPPVDKAFIPVAIAAIELAEKGDFSTSLSMPNGLTRSVKFIVENLHLEPFVPGLAAPDEESRD